VRRSVLRPRNLVSVIAATGIAAFVVFLGLRMAEGQPPTPAPTGEEVIPVPTDIVLPTPGPLTIVFPGGSTVNVRGTDIQLPPGITYSEGFVSEGVGRVRLLQYDDDLANPGYSWIRLDDNGVIEDSQIRPQDAARFEPLVEALGGLPTPSVIEIEGRQVRLSRGMKYL
jgi:hypothetical protein